MPLLLTAQFGLIYCNHICEECDMQSTIYLKQPVMLVFLFPTFASDATCLAYSSRSKSFINDSKYGRVSASSNASLNLSCCLMLLMPTRQIRLRMSPYTMWVSHLIWCLYNISSNRLLSQGFKTE